MQFQSGYESLNDLYGAMDRPAYESVTDPDTAGSGGSITTVSEMGIGINDIGMSVPLGISAPNVQGVYSKIRSGVSKMELGFPGAVSGNRQAHTPEMYGKDQRQAMRELGEINEVEFTTHSAYQIMGMTGAVEQGGDLYKFDMNRARMGQHEVDRAIDFAADISKGGSVVVHTGEFERPLTDMYLLGSDKNLSIGDGRIMFKKRLTEDKDAKFYLIDDRTGQAMSTVEKDRRVSFPKWNRYQSANTEFWGRGNGNGYTDEKGNKVRAGDYLDYRGNKIIDPFDPARGRVPEFNRESGRFQVQYMTFDDFGESADEKNKFFEIRHGRKPNDYEKVTQTEAFLQATLETNEGHSRGWALQYAERADTELEQINRLHDARKFYERLDNSLSEAEKWKTMKQDPLFNSQVLNEIAPTESKNPLEIIDKSIKQIEKGLEFARQASASQEQQAWDTAETKKHIVDPIKYVEKYAIRHYTESALHAMERSVDPNNPIVITMENIFPERFGGHPQELKWLIDKAREKFVDYLTEPKIELGLAMEGEETMGINPETGKYEPRKLANSWYRENISKEQAKKLAEQHIKATIDTGHLNMWRKYFQQKPGATPEHNEAEFKNWYLGQIEDLAKGNYIGNMHLTDNYGYQDDHLAPGQGNTPVKETVAILKKFGYDKALTVEPGADAATDLSDFHGLMKTWRYFGSPIYGMSAPAAGRQEWGQVQHSYFGQNQPPYFVFGAYSPSNDWTLWSETPME